MTNETKVTKHLIILNQKGLHTRPATELVKCAQMFCSEISLNYQGMSVCAKSIMSILMLGATRGAKVEVVAEGKDAEKAVEALIELAKNRFDIVY